MLGFIGYFKARRALQEVATLRVAVQRMAMAPPGETGAASAPESASQPVGASVEPEPVLAEPAPSQAAPSQAAPPQAAPPQAAPPQAAPPRARIDIEVLLTQRWGVWLGAAALLLSAVFLVRTAVEQGWLGPGARCALAGVLGLGLVAAAEWLRRRPSSGMGVADLGPSALAAGGVAAWFAGAYGAGPLYGLVPALVGFVLLGGAGLAGLALSLRFGALVGVAGLAGAFATPLLVDAREASAPGLFAYLLLVSAAAWAVVRYTAWVWLGWAAAVAGAAWVFVFVASPGAPESWAPESWAPGLFVPAATALSFFLLPGAALEHPMGRRLAWVPLVLLGLAGLLLAGATGEPVARMGVLLLAPLAVTKGWTEPRLAWLPFVPALLFLGVLLGWALPSWDPTGEAIYADGVVQAVLPGGWAPSVIVPLLETAAAMAAWFAAAGLFLERRSARPVAWAALAASVPVATLAVTYAQVGQFQPRAGWAFAALALAGLLVGAAWLARPGLQGMQRAGTYAAGAVAALALGCAIVLDEGWLTLAVALMLPALARIEAAAELPALRRVAVGVALLVLVRLVLNPYVLDYRVGDWPVLNPLLLAYGVPAGCFGLAAWWFRRRGDDLVVGVLEAGACAFVAALAGLEVHHWAAKGAMRQFEPGFRELALDVSMLGVVAVLLQQVALRRQRGVILVASRLIGGLALAGGVVLILRNPAVTGDPIGPGLLGNALLTAYAVPALLTTIALWFGARPRRLLAAYAGAAGFTWVTLEVRQAFHRGRLGVSDVPMLDAELWAYSGAWLLLGAGLMAAGLWTGLRGLRLAALALIGLAAAKVFLVDLGGLHGLWRVLSFLGLGLSLIGLGAFYRRFVDVGADGGGRNGDAHDEVHDGAHMEEQR